MDALASPSESFWNRFTCKVKTGIYCGDHFEIYYSSEINKPFEKGVEIYMQ